MIMFRNWTNNFKHQFAKFESDQHDALLANVSHEMRTPINTILKSLDMLEGTRKDKILFKKTTKICKTSANFLNSLVNDMLDMYMMKNGKFTTANINFVLRDMIEEVFDMFIIQATKKGIKLKRTFSKNCPYGISTDRKRLKQVLVNLITNANKFTSSGRIAIDVDFDSDNK